MSQACVLSVHALACSMSDVLSRPFVTFAGADGEAHASVRWRRVQHWALGAMVMHLEARAFAVRVMCGASVAAISSLDVVPHLSSSAEHSSLCGV